MYTKILDDDLVFYMGKIEPIFSKFYSFFFAVRLKARGIKGIICKYMYFFFKF